MEPAHRGDASGLGRGEEGFTLVEVLVAFAIVALAALYVLRIGSEIAVSGRRVMAVETVIDEAEGLVQLRIAGKTLRPGVEQGSFSNGTPWTLEAADIGPAIGWQNQPPLWRVRLHEGGLNGRLLYSTLLADGLGG